jgi:arginyl-tRNA synthetase
MLDLKTQLKLALENALPDGTQGIEVVIQDVPDNKPGDYGSPVAFQIGKALGQNPAQVAAQIAIALSVKLPVGIDRVEAVGPFLNFFVDPASFVSNVVTSTYTPEPKHRKVIIEHTSVNPNKEWHVGHIRGALIGDALGRIYRAAGYDVEIQNYIDDTGRQAAESLFAVKQYGAVYDGSQKYDHWLGELYVRLHKDLENPEEKAKLEPEIAEVIHALERGDLRTEIEKIVKSQLETAFSLGVEYDLLTWESDVVGAGFVAKALEILESSPHLQRPTDGPFAGTLGIDVSAFAPGQEEPYKVLVRSNGTFVYVTKDIGFHYWKFGLFEGLEYKPFEMQPSGKELWTSAPHGEHEPAGHRFAHANEVINVIDARQALQQVIVKASLAILEYGQEHAENFHHLANETVLLEGKTMSGRKGITVSADEVIAEAKSRALEVTQQLSPNLESANAVSSQVGLGALKFAFLKAEPKRQIDFRWEQALALQGDTAVVVQYAHARIRSIARKAGELTLEKSDWSKIGPLELKLARVIAKYPEALAQCVRDKTPHPMCAYALELATEFNAYYNHKGADGKADTSVLHAPEGLREARLALVVRVADAIKEALGVLGIEAPDEM